jgi:large subunit ribosomal protein L35
MPKIKTHKGMSKRVKKTGKGKLKRDRAFQSHLLNKKSKKKKRLFTKDHDIDNADKKKVKRLIES